MEFKHLPYSKFSSNEWKNNQKRVGMGIYYDAGLFFRGLNTNKTFNVIWTLTGIQRVMLNKIYLFGWFFLNSLANIIFVH